MREYNAWNLEIWLPWLSSEHLRSIGLANASPDDFQGCLAKEKDFTRGSARLELMFPSETLAGYARREKQNEIR